MGHQPSLFLIYLIYFLINLEIKREKNLVGKCDIANLIILLLYHIQYSATTDITLKEWSITEIYPNKSNKLKFTRPPYGKAWI